MRLMTWRALSINPCLELQERRHVPQHHHAAGVDVHGSVARVLQQRRRSQRQRVRQERGEKCKSGEQGQKNTIDRRERR